MGEEGEGVRGILMLRNKVPAATGAKGTLSDGPDYTYTAINL